MCDFDIGKMLDYDMEESSKFDTIQSLILSYGARYKNGD